MLLSRCVVCDSKKPKFLKEQDAIGLLHSLGIKTSLVGPFVGPVFFKTY